MRNADRYILQFHKMYELIRPILGPREPRHYQYLYAPDVFPHLSANSAQTRLSDCIAGRRPFPKESLPKLLACIDRNGLLKDLELTAWHGTLSEFRDALLSLQL